MIYKLIINIIIIGILVLFFGLNMDTKIDIHFWFNNSLTIENVSLFIALICAYLIGVVSTIPIYIISKIKRNKKDKIKKAESESDNEE